MAIVVAGMEITLEVRIMEFAQRSLTGRWSTLLTGMTLCLAMGTAAIAQNSPYKLEQTWKLGGDGGWDYLTVDSHAHLLYIARANRVMVVDITSGKETGEITGLKGVHGIALDPEGKYGYISDGAANEVRVFDRSNRQSVASIQAGTNPDSILFEPTTRSLYAFNGRSKNATVINTKSNKAIATITLPGKPEFSVTDGHGTVFVNIEDTNELVRIDAKSNTVTATWKLASCDSPSGLAFDIAHKRLFSVCDNKQMIVTNSDSGETVATPAIGNGPDAAGFDPKNNLAFSSNGDGTLTVVNADLSQNYSVLQTLTTQKSARTMALDPATGRIYLVAAEFGPRPTATPENPKPRPPVLPGTFSVLVVSR
jgi:YVTN family beta-propeller protein